VTFRFTAAVLLIALSGCGAEDPPGVDAGPLLGDLLVGGALSDGTGFVELADGADAQLVPGAQGGFHVWINVRVQGVAGPLVLEREARRMSDGALVLAGSRQAVEVPEDAMDDWWESPEAAPSFMCPAPVGIQVYDNELLFSVTLSDGDGAVLAEDELILVPRCPPDDDFCVSICNG
jgi:hypothetical protein